MVTTSFEELMKQGYIEMGEINLNIANNKEEFFDVTKFNKEKPRNS